MRIAVDAMGGDKGPEVVVQGVLDAARESEAHFLIVGEPKILELELSLSKNSVKNVEIVPADQIIYMEENPVTAFRSKPNASVVVSANLVKESKADGMVTIANTGAAVAVSHLVLQRIKGVNRPAIAVPLPTLTGTVVLLDAGATPDCDASNLLEFAIMGSAYSQAVFGVKRPKLGLLSIGEEDNKGNALVRKANGMFREIVGAKQPYEFIGNIEGKDIYRGNVDVVVCDGFVGNTVLKTSEGVAEMIMKLLREELGRNVWLTPLLQPFKPTFKRLRKRIDYAERGGAPLLGINGVCIIGHGRSDAFAVKNACIAAERAVRYNLVEIIKNRLSSAASTQPSAHQEPQT